MPGWYAKLKPALERQQVVLLGVIQEQHADRCRLFQQWQQLDFPVVQDQLNTTSMTVVPVYVALDEHGVVQALPRRWEGFGESFLAQPAPTEPLPALEDLGPITVEQWEAVAEQSSPETQIGLADALIQWQPDLENVDRAIDLYRAAMADGEQGSRPDLQFRLGVAYRLRYELGQQQTVDDFRKSVGHWEAALKANPNQYIYRRRIEQYGPRLKKPYSFYDWVQVARNEIRQRGETPIPLAVEPNGAELAQRARGLVVEEGAQSPDPSRQVELAPAAWVQTSAAVVPSRPQPGDVVAVHLGFQIAAPAKWNHESEPLQVWLDDPPTGVRLSQRLVQDTAPHRAAESTDPISLSWEVEIPENQKGPFDLKGSAWFHVCEDEGGQCVYRRHDFEVQVPVGVPESGEPSRRNEE